LGDIASISDLFAEFSGLENKLRCDGRIIALFVLFVVHDLARRNGRVLGSIVEGKPFELL